MANATMTFLRPLPPYMRNPLERRFTSFLLLTMALHVCFLLLHTQEKRIEDITYLPEAPLKIKVLPDSLSTRQQIARSEDTENREAREKAFLSDKTRSFDRQTKARKVDTFNEGGQGAATVSPRMPRRSKSLSLSELGTGKADPFLSAAQEYTEVKNGTKSGKRASRGVSSTSDHLEDIPPGDLTQLNTVEFKYYGFYHRIRQKLEQFWNRSIQETAESLIREGRVIASDEHVTSLQVIMNAKGEIIGINVVGPSGVREFDEAAIESFNKAGPFPHPPRDLIVDGRVVIEWGFHLST